MKLDRTFFLAQEYEVVGSNVAAGVAAERHVLSVCLVPEMNAP